MDFNRYSTSKGFSQGGENSRLTLTPEEENAYAFFFSKADVNNIGSISANAAFEFLTKSKLSFEILNEIWKATSINSTLTRDGFYKALKYVSLAQNNQPVNPVLLYAKTPLPIFEGIFFNNNINQKYQNSSNQDLQSLTITDIEREKWTSIFYQSNPVNNNISGNIAKVIFMKSNLSTIILRDIWQLVDLENSGELDLNEFLLAMLIIMRLKDNTINEVPRSIPTALWKSIVNSNNKSLSGLSSSNESTNFSNRGSQRLGSLSGENTNMGFENNFNISSPIPLNRTGSNIIPTNITGNNIIPTNITGGSIGMVNMNTTGNSGISLNKTGGSNIVPVNKTGGSSIPLNRTGGNSSMAGRNSIMNSPGPGLMNFKKTSIDNSMNNFQNPSTPLMNSMARPNPSLGLQNGSNNKIADWAITQQEQEKYDQLFNGIDILNNQYITGEQSMNFFLKSGLSTEDLSQIWELADISKSGKLTREEFYIAMHLIRQKKSGMELPLTLPACLVPPSYRVANITNSVASNSPPSAMLSSNLYKNQPLGSNPSVLASQSSSYETNLNKYSTNMNNNSNTNSGVDALRNLNINAENEINHLKTDIQQIENHITNINQENQTLKSKHTHLDSEIKELTEKKHELALKLSKLRVDYDTENLMINDLKATLVRETQTKEAAQMECQHIESLLEGLKNEKLFIEHDIERSKEETAQLNQRTRELNADYLAIKEEIERLTAEQKHQNDILNVTRQMTIAEQQRLEQTKQEKMNILSNKNNERKKLENEISDANSPAKSTNVDNELKGNEEVKEIILNQPEEIANPFEQETENDQFGSAFSHPEEAGHFDFSDSFTTPVTTTAAPTTTINNNQENEFNAQPNFQTAFDTPFGNGFDDEPFNSNAQTKANDFSNFTTFDNNDDHGFNDAFKISSPQQNTQNDSNNQFDAFQVPNSVPTDKIENNDFANQFDDAFQVPSNVNEQFSANDNFENHFDNSFQVENPQNTQNDSQINEMISPKPNSANKFDEAFQVAQNTETSPNEQISPSFVTTFDDAFQVTNETNTQSNQISPNSENHFDDAFQVVPNSNVNDNTNSFDIQDQFESAFQATSSQNENKNSQIPSEATMVKQEEQVNQVLPNEEVNPTQINNNASPNSSSEIQDSVLSSKANEQQNSQSIEENVELTKNSDIAIQNSKVVVAEQEEPVIVANNENENQEAKKIEVDNPFDDYNFQIEDDQVIESNQDFENVDFPTKIEDTNPPNVTEDDVSREVSHQSEVKNTLEENNALAFDSNQAFINESTTKEKDNEVVEKEKSEVLATDTINNNSVNEAAPEKPTSETIVKKEETKKENQVSNGLDEFEPDFNKAFEGMIINDDEINNPFTSNPINNTITSNTNANTDKKNIVENENNNKKVNEQENMRSIENAKSLSNNSIKIDDIDIDREFQEAFNDSENFTNNNTKVVTNDKETTNINTNSTQNNDMANPFEVNNTNFEAFEADFENGFDDSDFKFDTTFTVSNQAQQPPQQAVPINKESSTNSFEMFNNNFDFGNFSQNFNQEQNNQSKEMMDEAFGTSNAISNNTTNDNSNNDNTNVNSNKLNKIEGFGSSAFDNDFSTFNDSDFNSFNPDTPTNNNSNTENEK